MSGTALPWPTTGVVELSRKQRSHPGCGLPLPVLDVEERQTKHASCGMPPRPARKTTRRTSTRRTR